MFKVNRVMFVVSLATILCACQLERRESDSAAGPVTNEQSRRKTEVGKRANPPKDYVLVWSDEFTVNGLPDPSKWSYDTEANATGWFNNELQYYAAARLENSEVRDGVLVITARKEALSSAPDYGGQAYTSARLITRDKVSWTYGFFEIRAKLPCGLGTWPAIWMLGTRRVAWPANGEIDIMEHAGSRSTKISGTIHTGATAGNSGVGGSVELTDACTSFHNYQLTWTADSIEIGVDNAAYFSYKNPRSGDTAWPFGQPQYLILNLAIGGSMGGTVDNSIFPARMKVEHVRVYQRQ